MYAITVVNKYRMHLITHCNEYTYTYGISMFQITMCHVHTYIHTYVILVTRYNEHFATGITQYSTVLRLGQ